jgi:diguanylate cyclase (GGDEF)-like protein
MSLDTSTLYLVATLVAAMLGGMLLFFGRQEKIAALNWWGYAYLLGSASVALWTLASGLLGNFVSLLLYAVGFMACAMVWNAARVFHGRKPNWGGQFLGAAVWVAAVASLPTDAAAWRMTLGAAIVAAYAALTAGELWSERRKKLQKRWPTGIVPLLHGFVLMLPILLGDLLCGENTSFTGSVWVTAFAVELVLYAVGTVFLIFMLVSERTVSAHKAAASCDPLTGMFNRRGFAEATSRMIEREAKAGRPVTVMIFDIDHFKSINDRFGHPAGDEILKLFAGVIVNSLRITDLSGRIGGEEFAALLPCSLEEALHAAERVREAFATSGIVVDDAPLETTVSIGVAGGPSGTELEVLLAAADTALYQAKRSGRNRVLAAEEEAPLSLEQGRRAIAAKTAPKPPGSVVRSVNMAASRT